MGSTDLFELANLLSILLAARKPQWVEQTTTTGAPSSASSGVALQDSPRTLVLADLRREVHRRTAIATIRVLSLTGTYRVTVNGNVVDYDATAGAPADLDALLTQWAAAINGDVTVGAIVQATATDTTGDGNADKLYVQGLAEADYSIAYQTTVGTAEVDWSVDAVSGNMRAFFYEKGPNNPGRWRLANGAAYALSWRGWADRFDTAGLARGYVEISDLAGPVGPPTDGVVAPSTLTYWSQVYVGPSVDERS